MDYVRYIRSMVGNRKIFLNAAACIIPNEHNDVLLQHRGDDHYWGLPGGIMELGETMEETCRREVEEETGLMVGALEYLGAFHNMDKRWPNGDMAHIICHVFVARDVQGDLRIDGEETLDLRYVQVGRFPPMDATDHRQALAQYYKTEPHLL